LNSRNTDVPRGTSVCDNHVWRATALDSHETFLLVSPDGACRSLTALPTSRDEAIDLIHRARVGLGTYTFARDVSDPDGGEIRIVEIAISTYAGEELGLTHLTMGGCVVATAQDISRYLQAVTGGSGESPLNLSLDVYEDDPDCEGNYAWLCLEDSSGRKVAEFGLAVRNRLSLPRQPESPTDPVYVCEFPTLRSAFRFVEIARETFRCDYVRFRSYPLNSRSAGWFS
jgi:hypothetical protein